MERITKVQLLEEYLSTPEKRRKLVEASAQPLKLRVQYYTLWSKVFVQKPYVVVDLDYEIAGGLRRTLQESKAFPDPQDFEVMDDISKPLVEGLDRLTLAFAREHVPPTKFEGWDSLPETQDGRLLLNPRDYADLRKDPQVKAELNYHYGKIAHLGGEFRGSMIFTSRLIEPGVLYHFGPPEEVAEGCLVYDVAPLDNDATGIRVTIDHLLHAQTDPSVKVYFR